MDNRHRGLIRLLSASGLARVARVILAGKGRFALMFHGVASRRYSDIPHNIQPSLCADDLRAVLAWLADRFEFLTPHEFLDTKAPGVLLTFDDGQASNYNVALPMLEAYNAPVVFFVTTQHIIDPGDWLPASRKLALAYWASEADVPAAIAEDLFNGMTVDQLKVCAAHPLVTIGAHSRSHPFLTQCSPSVLNNELVETREWLQTQTGQPVDLFAYPTGDYNRQVAEAVRQAGYCAAFVEQPVGIGMPYYEIPRIGIYESTFAYLDVKLSGLYQQPFTR